MTNQAKNSLELYKGGNPTTIAQLLMFQKQEVVNELKEHFGVDTNFELAEALAVA